MKKLFVLFIITVFIFLAFSCEAKVDIDLLDRIYMLEDNTLSSSPSTQKESSMCISSDVVLSYDKNAVKEKKLQLFGKELSITYKESYFYPIGDKTLDAYAYVNAKGEEVLVMVDQKGELCGIMQSCFATLDINNTDSKETVRKALESKLSGIVDFSKYNHVEIVQSVPGTETFGLYTFFYYNILDGYIADSARVAVTENGEVVGLSIWDVGVDITEVNIDKSLEAQTLELKIKDLCVSAGVELDSFGYDDRYMTIRLYDGELYIKYTIDVITKEEPYPKQVQLLVPIDIIS